MNNNYISRFSFFGFLAGLLITILVTLNGVVNHSQEVSLYGIFEYVKTYKMSWLFFFVIITLSSVLGYIFGIYFSVEQGKLQERLNEELEKSKKIYEFTEQLRKGGSQGEEIKLSNDALSQSLINLRDDWQKREKEENIRKEEEYQRHWITEGLASFGVVLRATHSNLETLSYSVVSELSKYLNAQIVGIFVINDTDPENKYIEQTGSFAYERKKFTDKKIEWGEGLVGGCILEKKTVFIEDATEDYVEITSGLGKSNPRCILIVPLMFNEEIYGAIEIASLRVLQAYEIEFVEKLSDSIASSISGIKINMRTAVLLKDSQKGQEIMKSQEAEMRKSMRELRQIQLASTKQSEEFVSFTNSVNFSLLRAEYDVDGNLIYANSNFLNKLGYSSDQEVKGQNVLMFITEDNQEWFNDLWKRIVKGRDHFEGELRHLTKTATELWTMSTYVTVKDPDDNPTKVLFLGMDMTKVKQEISGYTGQIAAINRSIIKAEFTTRGKILQFNQKFQEAMFYESLELQNKSIFDFISPSDINEFSIIWKNIAAGVPFERRIKMLTKNGEDRWFNGTFSTLNDLDGNISKVVYIAYDVTHQVRTEKVNQQQSEKIERQEVQIQQGKDNITKKLREVREEIRLQYADVEVNKIVNEKILEQMPEAIISINQDEEIVFFNEAAENLWGIEKGQVLNHHIKTLLPDDYRLKGDADYYMGAFFNYGTSQDILNIKRKAFIVDQLGEVVDVVVSMSEAQFGKVSNMMAFVRKA